MRVRRGGDARAGVAVLWLEEIIKSFWVCLATVAEATGRCAGPAGGAVLHSSVYQSDAERPPGPRVGVRDRCLCKHELRGWG